MSKFWTIATLLLLTGITLLFYPGQSQGINFTDLETECRYDRQAANEIDLNHRRMSFQGQFPVNNPDADMSYSYSKTSNSVTLNVQSSPMPDLTSFYNNCKAVGVYDAETERLEPGRYMVTLEHNGREVNKRIIEVN